MKKAMLLICGVIFFVGCANRIDPTLGDKCKPKWYKAKSSDSKIVYGYSRESSRSSSLATSIGLAAAQAAIKSFDSNIVLILGGQNKGKTNSRYSLLS